MSIERETDSDNLQIVEKNSYQNFNDTSTEYPRDKTIVNLFEEQTAKTPENIAIRFKNKTLSYGQLNEKSNKLARHLSRNGLKLNDNVGIIVTRCPDLIIAVLAVLKAGGAYVPIDPDYPLDRQEYILQNSNANLIITNLESESSSLATRIKTIFFNEPDLEGLSSENLNLNIGSRQLAYTIYTSGSTGRPKGVMIEHHSVVNLVLWVNATFNIGEKDVLLFITSICFDLSVYDIFGILSSGGSIAIADEDEVRDISKTPTLLKDYHITFWDSVPSTLDFVIRNIESSGADYKQNELRTVFLSGDWIPVTLPARIKKHFPNSNVISLGGATEATVWSNYFPVKKVESGWKSIPYGKPIFNNFFYILDEQLKPVAFGEPGELFIGGVGVARGYANDLEKTTYSFVEDPFHKDCGGRMYRTGDTGRMLEDGNMEFLGRKDQQVKIRGFRVELGEIENVIKQHKLVAHAVVLPLDINGAKRLVGYVVPKTGYEREVLIAFLKRKLPDYMVPGAWMELDALPLTNNGKIDRKGLPEFTIENQNNRTYIAPRNEPEIEMAAIWQKLLGVPEISINDNFFDLGGQSLLAVQLLVEVEKKYGKKLFLNTIFKYSTIEQLVAHLNEDLPKESYKSLLPIKSTGSKIPLYIIHGDGYNFSNFKNLAGCLDNEQPVYALQPLGLDGITETYDTMELIAKHYVAEIMRQNPSGPYALAGYSFGGYVAVEMRNQFENLGKTVKMLGIFDTDASNLIYKKGGLQKLPKKVFRQIPKAFFILKSLITHPKRTINYQKSLAKAKFKNTLDEGKEQGEIQSELDKRMMLINEKHAAALKNYEIIPFKGTIHLFKAKTRIYFVDDFKYLGWNKFALNGVKVHDIPGDHKTMFLQPNVQELGKSVQNILDIC